MIRYIITVLHCSNDADDLPTLDSGLVPQLEFVKGRANLCLRALSARGNKQKRHFLNDTSLK